LQFLRPFQSGKPLVQRLQKLPELLLLLFFRLSHEVLLFFFVRLFQNVYQRLLQELFLLSKFPALQIFPVQAY
jgi:hypothetical protein